MPRRANRRGQVGTVVTVQPSSGAIAALGQPWCASSAILARRTSAWGADGARVIASSRALRRAPNITMSLLAARAIDPPFQMICADHLTLPGNTARPGGDTPGTVTMGLMPVPSKRLKDPIEGTVDHHPSQRCPALEEVTITCRGAYGYLTD